MRSATIRSCASRVLFPEFLQNILEQYMLRHDCDEVVGGSALLALLAGVTCGSVRVRPFGLEDTTLEIPCNLYCLFVGESGSGKSTFFKEVLAPLNVIQAELDVENLKLRKEYKQRKREAEKRKETFDEDEPIDRVCRTQNATYEALHETMSGNPRGITILRDEMGGFLERLNDSKYREERDFYLEAWYGDRPFEFLRIQRGRVVADNVCITLIGDLVPTGFAEFLAREKKKSDGFLHRMQLLVRFKKGPEGDMSPVLGVGQHGKNLRELCHYIFKGNSVPANREAKLSHGDFYHYMCFEEGEVRDKYLAWWKGNRRRAYRLGLTGKDELFVGRISKYDAFVCKVAALMQLVYNFENGVNKDIGMKSLDCALWWVGEMERQLSTWDIGEFGSRGVSLDKFCSKFKEGIFTVRDVCLSKYFGSSAQERTVAHVRAKLKKYVDNGELQLIGEGTYQYVGEINKDRLAEANTYSLRSFLPVGELKDSNTISCVSCGARGSMYINSSGSKHAADENYTYYCYKCKVYLPNTVEAVRLYLKLTPRDWLKAVEHILGTAEVLFSITNETEVPAERDCLVASEACSPSAGFVMGNPAFDKDEWKEQTNILDIARSLGANIPEEGYSNEIMINCLNPDHEDNNPSMSLNVEKGIFHCFSCEVGGDVIELDCLARELSFKEWCEARSSGELEPIEARPRDAIVEKQDRTQEALDLWEAAEDYPLTQVENYFRFRAGSALTATNEHLISRITARCRYHAARSLILIPFPDKDGNTKSIHRYYLDGKTSDLKRNENNNRLKRFLGSTKGYGMWFSDLQPKKTLCLYEGVESMLGVWLSKADDSAWLENNSHVVAGSAPNLGSFVIPAGVEKVCVYADPDDAGVNAYKKLVERNCGIEFSLYLPCSKEPVEEVTADMLDGLDFLDSLLGAFASESEGTLINANTQPQQTAKKAKAQPKLKSSVIASETALAYWEQCSVADIDDLWPPYCVQKKLPLGVFRFNAKDKCLVIPVSNCDTGALISCHRVNIDTAKESVLNGTKLKQGVFIYQDKPLEDGQSVYLCEDVAIAYSIFVSTGITTMAAFTLTNLGGVLKIVEHKYDVTVCLGFNNASRDFYRKNLMQRKTICAPSGSFNDVFVKDGIFGVKQAIKDGHVTLKELIQEIDWGSFVNTTNRFAGKLPPIKYLQTLPEALAALSSFNSETLTGLDFETTGLSVVKGASVRLMQVYQQGNSIVVIDVRACGGLDKFKQFFENHRFVGHNSCFELTFLRAAGIAIESIEIDCTLLAYHSITNAMINLEDLTEEVVGFSYELYFGSKKKMQKSNWDGELSSEQIVYSAVDAYMPVRIFDTVTNPSHGLFYNQQVYERMREAQVANTDCSLAGIALDVNDHNEYKKKQREVLEESRACLLELLPGLYREDGSRNDKVLSSYLLTVENWPLTDKGNPHTDKDTLEEKAHLLQGDFGKHFNAYQSSQKALTTFGDGLNVVNGRAYGDFQLSGTRTGRLSCNNSNLQNLPSKGEEGAQFRRMFKAPKGKKLLIEDFGQQETRILACEANDTVLLTAFNNGEDLHSKIVAMAHNREVDVYTKNDCPVLQKDDKPIRSSCTINAEGFFEENGALVLDSKDKPISAEGAIISTVPDVWSVTKSERGLGKILNFGRAYGMTPETFMGTVNSSLKPGEKPMTPKQAKDFFNKAEKATPITTKWQTQLVTKAIENMYVETVGGRRRLFAPHLRTDQLPLTAQTFAFKREAFKATEVLNTPVQGGAAEIMLEAMAMLPALLSKYGAKLVNIVHDECVVEVDEELADALLPELDQLMIDATLKLYPNMPLNGYVKGKKCDSWGEK